MTLLAGFHPSTAPAFVLFLREKIPPPISVSFSTSEGTDTTTKLPRASLSKQCPCLDSISFHPGNVRCCWSTSAVLAIADIENAAKVKSSALVRGHFMSHQEETGSTPQILCTRSCRIADHALVNSSAASLTYLDAQGWEVLLCHVALC